MDGQLVDSLVGLAYILVANADQGWSDSPDQDVDQAEELVDKALTLEPKIAAAHRVKSWIFGYRNRLPESIAAAETAIFLNRNDSMAHRLLALFELQAGRPERSRAVIEQAMRLSPRDPNHWGSLAILARAQSALGECEMALSNFASRSPRTLTPVSSACTLPPPMVAWDVTGKHARPLQSSCE
jgi:tetratricopeptide (TPR) repeat protein